MWQPQHYFGFFFQIKMLQLLIPLLCFAIQVESFHQTREYIYLIFSFWQFLIYSRFRENKMCWLGPVRSANLFFYYNNTLKVANLVECFNTVLFWCVKLILFTRNVVEQNKSDIFILFYKLKNAYNVYI